MKLTILATLVIVTLATKCQGSLILNSSNITNWGSWGSWDRCDQGTHATGFQLLVEHFANRKDESGLNGIALSCTKLGHSAPSVGGWIKSTTGKFGSWGEEFLCDNGALIGIQLRVQAPRVNVTPPVGQKAVVVDETAANNVRFLCSNPAISWIEGDGTNLGTWGQEQVCQRGQTICGIQTQVSRGYTNIGDDTGLNNVNIECCDLPDPTKDCNPVDRWEFVQECNNIKGTSEIDCPLNLRLGVHLNTSVLTEAQKAAVAVYAELGFDSKYFASSLAENFGNALSPSLATEMVWAASQDDGATWGEGSTKVQVFKVPPRVKSRFYQVVGDCGVFDVLTRVVKRQDTDITHAFPSSQILEIDD